MKRTLIAAALSFTVASCGGSHAPEASHDGAPHWAYTGDEGPSAWGDLSTEWATCSVGEAQSPIDLPAQTAGDAPVLSSVYRPVGVTLVNNGHTVRFDAAGGGGITVDGHGYDLLQFHVHFPSEHSVEGRQYPGEIHFVHADSSGALAVVAVLVEAGDASRLFESAVAALQVAAKGTTVDSWGDIDAHDVIGTGSYRAYPGSLTTPPCSEGVRWFVMESPITFSPEQISVFEAAIGVSNRPVQPLGDRTVSSGSISG